MKKTLILLLPILMLSCSAFYEYPSKTEEQDLYRVFKMPVEKDTLKFNAYLDYYHDTIDLPAIYLTKKELQRIKKSTLTLKKNKQILFLHNDTPYYLNIVGFYYPDLYLKEIQAPELNYTPINLANGVGYDYIFEEKKIADLYVPFSKGVLRFIAVGNPKWSKITPDKFDKEVDYVFFVLNSSLFKLKAQ